MCEGLLPMQAFARKPGFLPQFKDMHVSLTGGSFEFCDEVVTKLVLLLFTQRQLGETPTPHIYHIHSRIYWN